MTLGAPARGPRRRRAARRAGDGPHAGQPRRHAGLRVPRLPGPHDARPRARRGCRRARRGRGAVGAGAGLEPPVLPRARRGDRDPAPRAARRRARGSLLPRPSADLRVAGITGTNGKTTTAYLLAQASDFVGRRGWYIGTLGHGHPGDVRHAGLTTPDAVTVQRRLAEARDAGARRSASKCRRTRSTRTASPACASTRPCSPT